MTAAFWYQSTHVSKVRVSDFSAKYLHRIFRQACLLEKFGDPGVFCRLPFLLWSHQCQSVAPSPLYPAPIAPVQGERRWRKWVDLRRL